MHSNGRLILAGISAVVLFVMACSFSFSTANIADAWMSTDEEGNNRTTSFAQDDVFYAHVDLRNAPDHTRLKAVWTAVEVEDTQPNLTINETEFVSGSGTVRFELSNTDLWPRGKYKVDIYMNDELAKTLEFEVR
ncbi:MAG: hypothetical protein Kow0047_17430 [Anaerolineae bacterium]